MAIITDYVDGPLTDFLRLLVTEYLDFGMRERGNYITTFTISQLPTSKLILKII